MREFRLNGAVSESGRQVPVPRARPRTVPDTTLNRIRCPAFSRVFPKNRCERAASGIFPGTKKFFCKNVFHTNAKGVRLGPCLCFRSCEEHHAIASARSSDSVPIQGGGRVKGRRLGTATARRERRTAGEGPALLDKSSFGIVDLSEERLPLP